MKIEYHSLTLENFGPYYGTNVLEFAPGGQGTAVTLVDGKNGYGKTTVLKAFDWLLYGERDARKRYGLFNRTATNESEEEMSVQLQFRYKGETHQVIRTLSVPPGVSYEHAQEEAIYLVDGEPQANFSTRVREVLPEPASQFFFFNGAKIDRYADLENDRAVREAIEMVLGLPAYENAIAHLRRLRDRWRKSAREKQKQDAELRVKVQKLEKLEESRDSLSKQQETKEKQIQEYEERKEEINAELQKFEGLKDRLAQIRELETKHANAKERLSELREEQAQQMRTYAQIAVLPILRESLSAKTEKRDKLANHREGIERRKFVMEFIEELEDADGASIQELLPELKELADELYPTPSGNVTLDELPRLETEVSELRGIIKQLETYNPQETQTRLQTYQTRVAQYESELRNARRKLGDVDEAEAKDLQQELERINKEIGSLNTDVNNIQEEVKSLGKEVGTLQRQVAHASSGGDVRKLHDLAEEAEKLAAAFESALQRVEARKKASIEEHATELFGKLTRKGDVYAELRINNDYTLDLLDRDGLEHGRDRISAGEKQLVALSFIIGLMKSTEKVAPLVIDTPFGHLDKLHRENVMKHLPEIDQQLVFLVTDADIAEEHEPIINKRVGKKYVIAYDPADKVSTLEEVKA